MLGQQIITDYLQHREQIRAARYGVICVIKGKLQQITLRPWPKLLDPWTGFVWGPVTHRYRTGDRCWLYYNQPRWHIDYLAFKYLLSCRDTSLKSIFVALHVLDEIARLKQSQAILADAANLRISERLIQRLGWERHTASTWHRNVIKRFYGQYPALSPYSTLFQAPAPTMLVSPSKSLTTCS